MMTDTTRTQALGEMMPRYVRHKKRGSTYEVIGVGKMQAENWFMQGEWEGETNGYDYEPIDMHLVVVYRSISDPTETWVRPFAEFNDGRFDPVTSPVPDEGGDGEGGTADASLIALRIADKYAIGGSAAHLAAEIREVILTARRSSGFAAGVEAAAEWHDETAALAERFGHPELVAQHRQCAEAIRLIEEFTK
jgi:hypothetical protein